MPDNLNTPYLGAPSAGSNINTQQLRAFSTDQAVVAISVATQSSTDTTFLLPNAVAGDAVVVGAPSALSDGLTFFAFASGASEGTLRLSNVTNGPVAQTAQTWRFKVLRP